jgi:hypothetical protein
MRVSLLSTFHSDKHLDTDFCYLFILLCTLLLPSLNIIWHVLTSFTETLHY